MEEDTNIIMRPVELEDLQPAWKFVENPARRTSNVMLRSPDVFKEPFDSGRGILLERGGAVFGLILGFALAKGQEITLDVPESFDGRPDLGRVCEFGTMLRASKRRVSTDPEVQPGPFKFLFTSGLKFYLLQQGAPFDIVTMGVCNTPSTLRLRVGIDKPPVNFTSFVPSKCYIHAAKELVGGADLSNTTHYRSYASKENLIPEAMLWRKIAKEGCVRDIRRSDDPSYNPDLKIDLDISAMKFGPLVNCLCDRGKSFMRSMPQNVSYSEVSRQLRIRSEKKAHSSPAHPVDTAAQSKGMVPQNV